jgi:SAM-dependent methyltransferase
MDINHYDIIADLYDTFVPIDYDLGFFVNECRRSSGEVLELMSGTGRVSVPLLKEGVNLTCVDLSAMSNTILERKLAEQGLEANIFQMDICDLKLPKKFDLIIIPFQSFAHITSPDNQRKALHQIYQHLQPGGTFICTLGNPQLRQQAVDGQLRLFRKYTLPEENGTLLLWIKEDFDTQDRQVVIAMEFFEEYDQAGVLRSKRLMELHFRLTGREAFEELAGEAGFCVKAFYGDYLYSEFRADTSPFMIWFLVKPNGMNHTRTSLSI